MSNHARPGSARKRSVAKIAGASGTILTLGAALVAVTPGTAGAATFTVDSAADDGGGGATTLREAIEAANAAGGADTITFAPGLNGQTITLASEIDIADDLSIQGPGATLLTVSGDDSSRVFYIDSGAGDVTVSGLTLTGGDAGGGGEGGAIASGTTGDLALTNLTISDSYAEFDGGGVEIDSAASVTITGTTFSGNYSGEDGGGLHVYDVDGPISISSSTFSDNAADNYGGGIALYQVGGTVTMTGLTVTNNDAAYGGGIDIYESVGSTVTITGSTITGNYADYSGGGIRVYYGGDLTITDSTISDNDAGHYYGGGIFFYDSGTLTITNTTLSGNTANDDGGAMSAIGSDAVIIDRSTISGNLAGEEGGGIHANNTSLTVLSSTISGNESEYGGGINFISDEGRTLTIAHSTITANNAAGDGRNAGGGLYLAGGEATIDHTIIAGNTVGDIGGNTGTVDLSNSVLGDSDTDGVTVTDGGNNDLDVPAGVGPLANNGGPTQTHALLDGSAALDSGDPAFAAPPATDQRGEARVSNDVIDKGAYERQVDEPVPPVPPAPPAARGTGATPVTANPTFVG